VQKWLSFVEKGEMRKAWDVMTEDNPFPAIMGRVCYHTCEKTCNRGQFDGAVNINVIEMSVGDIAVKNSWAFENVAAPSGKKVLIVGAGPSGLSAAYFLRKMGHEVTIYETHVKAGGMMRYGVPKYRLSRSVLDSEIKRIVDMGVEIVCNKRVTVLKDAMAGFDATYVAIGAHMASKADINITGDACVIDAIDLFRQLEDTPKKLPSFGKNVLVYGGGNTAVDAARSLLRLGAESVKIIYRRTINNMPAHKEEIHEALSEGIEILYLRSIAMIEGNKVLLNKMTYDEESDILAVSGETEVLHADSVVFAIGQSVDEGIWSGLDAISVSEKGLIDVDKNMMTGTTGVFAGGDAIIGKRTVTHAIGHGKKAARFIDAYLRGVDAQKNQKPEVANFKKLNTAYYAPNKRVEIGMNVPLSFEEKDISLSREKIVAEASRCFSCGNCFHCDNCYVNCPDNAIIKHDDGSLELNYDYCKGCGICETECPCGAIRMTSGKHL
jgi:NADPH-dependent glutamate synthase beta subunit-like oxidoreductase/Pyruvate/2-oxoacid:ferredoxin oxidoreductase delta subunit